MWLLVYHSVPLSVPCMFWKFEVSKRLGLKIGGGELRSLASYGNNNNNNNSNSNSNSNKKQICRVQSYRM